MSKKRSSKFSSLCARQPCILTRRAELFYLLFWDCAKNHQDSPFDHPFQLYRLWTYFYHHLLWKLKTYVHDPSIWCQNPLYSNLQIKARTFCYTYCKIQLEFHWSIKWVYDLEEIYVQDYIRLLLFKSTPIPFGGFLMRSNFATFLWEKDFLVFNWLF